MTAPASPPRLLAHLGPWLQDGEPCPAEERARPGRGPRLPGHVALSPGGDRLALAFRGRLRIHALAARSWVDLPLPGTGQAPGLAWSPDGSRLVLGAEGGLHLVATPLKGSPHLERSFGLPGVTLPVLSAGGERLAAAGSDGVRSYDLASGERLALVPLLHLAPRLVALLPDGATLLQASGAYACERDVLTGEVVRRWDPLPVAGSAFALLGDGRRLLVGGSRGPVHLVDLTTGASEAEWAQPPPCLSAAAGADAERLAVIDGQGRVHPLEVVTLHRTPLERRSSLRALEPPPTELGPLAQVLLCARGNVMALVAASGEVEVWELAG